MQIGHSPPLCKLCGVKKKIINKNQFVVKLNYHPEATPKFAADAY